jgi:hypothetical protein
VGVHLLGCHTIIVAYVSVVSSSIENPMMIAYCSVDEPMFIGYMNTSQKPSRLQITEIAVSDLRIQVESTVFDLFFRDGCGDNNKCVIASSLDVSTTEFRDVLVRAVKRYDRTFFMYSVSSLNRIV